MGTPSSMMWSSPVDPASKISLSGDGCSEELTKGLSDLKVGDTIAFTGPGWTDDSLPPTGGFTLADIDTWGCFTETAVVKNIIAGQPDLLCVGNLSLLNSSFPDTGETYLVTFTGGTDLTLYTANGEDYFNELFIAKIIG